MATNEPTSIETTVFGDEVVKCSNKTRDADLKMFGSLIRCSSVGLATVRSIMIAVCLVTVAYSTAFAEPDGEADGEAIDAVTLQRNVLFIVADDLRPELGCYGTPVVQSPNVDRLARRGMIFNRAYCQQAVCSPSRSSVMTGTRPDTTKVWDLSTHFRKALPDVVTLPELFKQQGYATRGIGKIYHGSLKDPQSWTISGRENEISSLFHDNGVTLVSKPVKRTKTDRGPAFRITDDSANGGGEAKLADEAISALQDFRETDRPFFLALGFHKPHLPFNVPKHYWDLYTPENIPMAPNRFLPKDAPEFAMVPQNEMWNYSGVPDTPHLPDDYARQLKHGYYASVSYMDAQLGRVLDELDRLQLTESTLVVLWGDHGWKLGEHDRWCKHSNVEDDARAPLIVCMPGMKHKNTRTDSLVEFVDIYPTVADLAGVAVPSHIEGVSLRPVLDDPDHVVMESALTQYPRTVNRQRLMGYSIRTDRYRFTRWVTRDDHDEVVATELYDHREDPMENTNVAGDPANVGVVAELARQWVAKTRGSHAMSSH